MSKNALDGVLMTCPAASVTLSDLGKICDQCPQKPSRAAAWWLACRPKTLPISLSPVLVGTALAWHDIGTVHYLPFVLAALAAALIQIGTNLFNDVGDFLRGTDTKGRMGPARATAEGWLSPTSVRMAAFFSFALAFVCGIYLVAHAGFPIVFIGILSIFAGWAYTCGPLPIAYRPLGEVFVWLFFGQAAVCGSYYLQTVDSIDLIGFNLWVPLVAALVGLHATAVITVNNYRDMATDAAHGKRTLAVVLGASKTRRLYHLEIFLPYLLLIFIAFIVGKWLFLPFLTLPFAFYLAKVFDKNPPSAAFNVLLAHTVRLQCFFSLLLALGFLLIGTP